MKEGRVLVLLLCLPGDRGVDFVSPPGWRGTSSTLESRLGLRTKCIKMWRLCIYLNRVPAWLVSIQHDLMKITEMFEKVVTWWSCAGKDRRGKVWWWRLLKWRKHLNTAITDICVIYLFLLGDFNLPEVPFPDHWCEVSPLPEAPVGSPVIIGRCCFCCFCSSTDSIVFFYCYYWYPQGVLLIC